MSDSKTKILIVDDVPENVISLAALLEANDLEIHTACTPDDALNAIFENEFALALLDVHMPAMSGFELARLIRGVERSRHMPIIFVTAQDKGGSLEFEGYDTGAVDVLYKPLDPKVVRSKVRVFAMLDRQSKQLHEQIRIASELREQAEAASLAKGRFLANMSHEIRTPLGAVLGFAELLGAGPLPEEERRRLASLVQRNGQLLMRVIDDVLDLSKIEAGRFELDPGNFDFQEMVRDLDLTLGHRAREKGLRFEFQIDSELKGSFRGDVTRIKQILLNVIGNAIKFTESGFVRVSATGKTRPDGLVDLRFLVEDSGVGLSFEQQRRLFHPFSQGDASTSKRFGGTGLGLTISRQLAKLHGGDVQLRSGVPGKGAVFEVWLPLPRGEGVQVPATRPGPRPANLEGRRVLVVDDLIDNRELMEMYLRGTGVELVLAESGYEALELHRHGAKFDVIFMDVQMPGMDGYVTTRALRKEGFEAPIVALTAHAMRTETQRCLDVGCDSVLTKPITRKALLEHLAQTLGDRPVPSAEA